MTDKDLDEQVMYSVRMPRRLRRDAKRKTERGELSSAVRELFERTAYGEGPGETDELERLKNELENERDHIDDLRSDRRRIDAKIETAEQAIARLEERISAIQAKRDNVDVALENFEAMLENGDRVSPRMNSVQDAAEKRGMSPEQFIKELQERNPDIPDHAFRLAEENEPYDWREL